MNHKNDASPFRINNVRRFIAFRVFFNARFYYPVFTILFLDFGLTLTQFALLNVAWAVTIVLLEVPSGALADIIGRRKLVVAAGMLMVIEMAILCFVPTGHAGLLFAAFLVNRVLSGAAEAAASGADEALAYDALKIEGDAEDWGRVLGRQMRFRALAYIGAMSLGAAVYDPALMQTLADLLHLKVKLTQDVTMRFPLYLTLVMSLLTLRTTLKMREVDLENEATAPESRGLGQALLNAFRLTIQAGRWILKTPFALMIILSGLLFDHLIRMLLTMNSQYYRLIQLPEATFGLIGSALAMLGLFIPGLALRLVQRYSPSRNYFLMSALILTGLIGMTFFWPYFGLVPAMLLSSVMYFVTFFVSHYLNRITESHQRATVLSFKGLSFNLAYGLIGILYSILLALLRSRARAAGPPIQGDGLENLVFIESISWFPWYFILTFLALVIFAKWKLGHTNEHKVVDVPEG